MASHRMYLPRHRWVLMTYQNLGGLSHFSPCPLQLHFKEREVGKGVGVGVKIRIGIRPKLLFIPDLESGINNNSSSLVKNWQTRVHATREPHQGPYSTGQTFCEVEHFNSRHGCKTVDGKMLYCNIWFKKKKKHFFMLKLKKEVKRETRLEELFSLFLPPLSPSAILTTLASGASFPWWTSMGWTCHI